MQAGGTAEEEAAAAAAAAEATARGATAEEAAAAGREAAAALKALGDDAEADAEKNHGGQTPQKLASAKAAARKAAQGTALGLVYPTLIDPSRPDLKRHDAQRRPDVRRPDLKTPDMVLPNVPYVSDYQCRLSLPFLSLPGAYLPGSSFPSMPSVREISMVSARSAAAADVVMSPIMANIASAISANFPFWFSGISTGLYSTGLPVDSLGGGNLGADSNSLSAGSNSNNNNGPWTGGDNGFGTPGLRRPDWGTSYGGNGGGGFSSGGVSSGGYGPGNAFGTNFGHRFARCAQSAHAAAAHRTPRIIRFDLSHPPATTAFGAVPACPRFLSHLCARWDAGLAIGSPIFGSPSMQAGISSIVTGNRELREPTLSSGPHAALCCTPHACYPLALAAQSPVTPTHTRLSDTVTTQPSPMTRHHSAAPRWPQPSLSANCLPAWRSCSFVWVHWKLRQRHQLARSRRT